jgi:hypothetical protein
MPRSARILLFAALLSGVFACTTPLSAQRTPPEGAVTLRFHWPETFSARLSHVTGVGGMKGQSTYGLRVEPGAQEGQRRLVAHRADVPASGLGSFVDPEVTVLFDREGNFLGAEQPEETPAMGLLEALPLDPEQQEQVRQSIGAAQKAVAQERWDLRVGRWRGVTLVPGAPVRRETTMWVGQNFLEREEMQAEERTSIEVDVPCTPDARERVCVRVIVETTPVRQYRESEPCERARALKRFELVTEPNSLLPYFVQTLRKDEMDWCRDDGTVSTREMVQMEEFVFTYGDGASFETRQ